jgi:ABC-type Na+ efflux pump permease subunit
MASIIDLLILGVPLMVLSLLVGLGACIAVMAQEGRGRSSAVSHLVGLINLVLIIPLTVLSWAAQSPDVRYMFMFAAGAFALVGLLGLRLPQRYRD